MTVTALSKFNTLGFTIGQTEVEVQGPAGVLDVLASTHRRHLREEEVSGAVVGRLRIRITSGRGTPVADAAWAGEQILSAIAEWNGYHILCASVLERNGRALALIGPRGSGKSALAVHLLARSWRLLADQRVFVARDGTVHAHQALMTISARLTPALPANFRGTIERSRWYTAVDIEGRQDLHFYEVDPAHAFGPKVWCERARLDAIVLLDTAVAEPRVHTVDYAAAVRRSDGTLHSVLPELSVSVRAGAVNPHRIGRCAEAIEDWFDVHAIS